MKNILLYLPLALMLFQACDQRLDFMDDVNQKPILILPADSGNFKRGGDPVRIEILISDPEDQLKKIDFEILEGNGTYMVNGVETESFTLKEKIIGEYVQTIYLRPLGMDNIVSNIILIDELGKKEIKTYKLNIFKNLLPVARFTYTNSGSTFTFDASTSYDQDAEYGGKIESYKWSIDNQSYIDTKKVSTYETTLSTTSQHIVKLIVEDNDKESSEEYSVVIE